MRMQSFKSVDAYIKSYPKDIQKTLRVIRATIRASALGAEEAMKYGIPTFVLGGNLVHFAAYKTHIGFYPGASAVRTFRKEIAKYKSSKGTVQFPIGSPIPLSLFTRIVKFRVKENLSKTRAKKLSSKSNV